MKIKDFKLGATGNFPVGKLDATDEGEIRFAVAADHSNGTIQIRFGKPVAWLGLYSNTAREMAKLLNEKADEIDKRKS